MSGTAPDAKRLQSMNKAVSDPVNGEHVELSANEARQAGPGVHVFVIWAISTLAVALGLLAIFAMNAAAT